MTREFWENYIAENEEQKSFDWWGWVKNVSSLMAIVAFIVAIGFVLWLTMV